MSIIKKPYTISVWDDVWNGEKFVEKRVCIIGSDKMESQCRAIEPNLTRNTNGTKKLTFKLYKRYKDNITGELVENPFYDWLVNERKVKLYLNGKWHDFIVKNISENSSNYLYTYQLEDALTQELSKNGFNVELNDELMNNSGTAEELAGKVLEETDWGVESEPFIERIEEALVWLTVRTGHSLVAQKIVDKDMTTEEVELGAGTNILAFYSSCANKPYRFQFIYVDGGLSKITKDDNRLITNADCQYYIDNPVYSINNEAYGFILPEDLDTTTVAETENSTGVTLSGEYRAKRYGFTQKSVFSPVLNRYVNIYKPIGSNGEVVDEEYYGYLNTEYKSPVLTQNILSNTEFTSTTGWIGTKEQGGKLATTENIVFRLDNQGNRTDTKLIDDLLNNNLKDENGQDRKYASYMKLAFSDDGTSRVINSGPYDNRVSIGNMEVGEEYALICTYDENNNPNLDFDLGEYTYQTGNGGYYVKDNSKIVFEKKNTDLPAGITAIFTVKSNTYSKKTFKKSSQVRLAITGVGTTYISNISLFKVVRDNGNIILPENQAEDINDRVIDTTYYFFKKDTLTSAANEEEVKPEATLKTLDYSQFIPVINEDAQKIRTISAKESNYFNILQSIAETFEAWLDFEITRDEDGTGAIINKKVVFRNYIGKNNPVGFKYGVNLKGIQRTFESKQIVTKLIVKDNSNEFADNGFCSIARAGANPTGENYIYDFQYFFNRGLLKARDYLDTLYSYDGAAGPDLSNSAPGDVSKYNLYGYFPRIKTLNRKIDERNEILINLSKDITILKAQYEVAQTGMEAASSGMEEAAADCVKTTGKEITAIPSNQGWEERTDVKKILQSYATYKIEYDKYVVEERTLSEKLKSVQTQYDTLASEIKKYKDHKIALNHLFFSRYSRFIQEGTWIDESYVDDEKYYADAQSTLYNSCYPKAAYTVNVIEISKLPGYEDFTYDLGDKTFIEDKEFFGSAAKVEVVLTETTENLDDPTKNKLKIQTFKNQFQDLFQKITATAQQTQYSTGSYEKAVALAEANQERKNQFVTDALDGADARLQVAGQQSVEIGDDGITITDVDTPSDKIRMVGGAILLSKQDKNGETKWVTGVTSDGVSASLITAGVLNAGEISIMNYDEPLFRWDSFGLSAFDNSDYTDENGIVVVSGVNPNKFVRFDKYGIYGINGGVNGANWHPVDISDINSKATFALTWDGLKVTGTSGTAHIGKHNNAIIRITNGINDTFVVKNNGTTLIGGEDGWKITEGGLRLNTNNNVYLGKPTQINNQQIVFKAGSNFIVEANGTLHATDGIFTGNITAKEGYIGGNSGWSINSGSITTGNLGQVNSFHMYSTGYTTTDASINKKYFGQTTNKTWKLGIGSNFGVTADGALYATGGNFSGSITGGTITIGGTQDLPNFKVDNSGNVTMKGSINLTGNITWGDNKPSTSRKDLLDLLEGGDGIYVDDNDNIAINASMIKAGSINATISFQNGQIYIADTSYPGYPVMGYGDTMGGQGSWFFTSTALYNCPLDGGGENISGYNKISGTTISGTTISGTTVEISKDYTYFDKNGLHLKGSDDKLFCNSFCATDSDTLFWWNPTTKKLVFSVLVNLQEGSTVGSSAQVTSDLTKKHSIISLPPVYSQIFDKLQPVSYKYNDGRSDRTHTGFIAQDVEQAVLDCGITTKDFAAVCYDLDEEGNKVDYTLRYEELIALCVNEIQKLKTRIAELESK